MNVIEYDNKTLGLKEFSKSVIFRSVILFLVGLLITINSGNNKNISMLVVFLTGPFLMALSVVIGIYSFSKINTIFDNRKQKALRYKVKFNKKKYETITLSGIDFIEIQNMEQGLVGLTSRNKFNINLRYIDGDMIVLNINKLTKNEALTIGYKIAAYLNIPMKRIK